MKRSGLFVGLLVLAATVICLTHPAAADDRQAQSPGYDASRSARSGGA